jgi:hypothetical protein
MSFPSPSQGTRRTQKHYRRVAWLKTHPRLLDIPTIRQDVTPAQSTLLDELAQAMRSSGFYSKHTSRMEVTWSIRVCAGEARE